MTADEYTLLVYKNLKGETSSEEFALLNSMTASSEDWAQLRIDIEDTWDLTGQLPSLVTQEETDKLLVGILSDGKTSKSESRQVDSPITAEPKQSKIFTLRRMLLGVAAISVLVLSAIFLMQDDTVTYKKAGVYALLDNTTVTLREGSEIKIHKFDDESRKVVLTGEAFFEVSKDSQRPFQVSTKHVDIEVLGTSFLVKERNEEVFVDLIEGKVKTLDKRSAKSLVLTEGMKARHSGLGDVSLMTNYENLSSWKDQFYQYKDTKLGAVLEELSVIFDAQIVVSKPVMLECKFTGNLAGDGLQALLGPIAKKYNMAILQENTQWTLSDGSCN